MSSTDNTKMIDNALEYLSTIPQMSNILKNLPENITYTFSKDTPGIASFDYDKNKIIISPDKIDLNNPEKRLHFYLTLAHELCHANQKKEDLYFNDLSGASFGDTFRVAKMMEIETRLLSVTLENELLKRDEFKNCTPTVDCQYYQQELSKANGDISQANTNFILTYWQNAKDNPTADFAKEHINQRYFFYMEQAFHQALLMHDPKFNLHSTNRTSPIDAINSYQKRMSVNILPQAFLQNEFDNVVLTDNFHEGITVLNHDGSKYLTLTPTENPITDKVIFLQTDKVFLRNGITKAMIPYPQITRHKTDKTQSFTPQAANLSALEIAIEDRKMDRIKDIIDKDPTVINRQTLVSKKFPLLMAIVNNNEEAASYILSKGPNLLLQTEDGKNVLTELNQLKSPALKKQIIDLYQVQKQSLTTHKSIN